jgi:hypothetical protein
MDADYGNEIYEGRNWVIFAYSSHYSTDFTFVGQTAF